MISVMNSADCEIDRGSDLIQQRRASVRVSDDKVAAAGDAADVDLAMSDDVVSSGRVFDLDSRVDSKAEAFGSEKAKSGFVRVRVEIEGNREVDSGRRTRSMVLEDDKAVVDGPKEGPLRGGDVGFQPMLSSFDNYVANEKRRVSGMRSSDVLVGYGFKVGDMVWGKVKSHPWWPGHIFNEAFASPAVRRARRDGHVLVAFYGDSSYGWFDPAELVHFDPHFAEKSRQTSARNFVRAVEEAVDEASRRSGLGLTCWCRNPYNFRPTDVQGYYVVDVPDFEPAGVYSSSQIGEARESFEPSGALSFIKQLAAAPRNDELNIDWIKKRAAAIAYRKAYFEEFDETYAQAFGFQPVRPSREPAGLLDSNIREPSRAPLSGPLVIAETLGDRKSSTKPVKVKSQKKDRYLFKRRDEPNNSKSRKSIQGHATISSQLESPSTLGVGDDYVFQKRATDVSMNPLDKGNYVVQEVNERKGPDLTEVSTSAVGTEFSAEKLFPSSTDSSVVNSQQQDDSTDESPKTFKPSEGFQQSNQSILLTVDGCSGPINVQDGPSSAQPLPTSVKLSPESFKTIDGEVKKENVLKRSAADLATSKFIPGEKKKKRKKEFDTEGSLPLKKHSAAGKGVATPGKVPKKTKSIETGLASGEDNLQKDLQDGLLLSNSSGMVTQITTENAEPDLSHLLSDLQSLALDPFHGLERKCPGMIRQMFSRFRSLVFQKSLVLSPPAETTEPIDDHSAKPPSSEKKARDLPSSRPLKPPSRSDDPTRVGPKRSPSDRQEEMAARKKKKLSDLKSLAAEKKAALTVAPEASRVEGKESLAPTPGRPTKLSSSKKLEPPPRRQEPTMLVMKFPAETSLPSAMGLKARFARYGPLDHSATRVFWKSNTCRVVFKFKEDAQAAYKYVSGNNSVFGNVSVRYHLREVDVPAPELAEPWKGGRAEEASGETLLPRDTTEPGSLPGLLPRPTLQPPSVQLKSCLKKSSGEEAGPAATGGRARVKFMLGGDESSGREREQLVVGGNRNNNFNSSASFGDGALSSTSVAMDFNSKTFQKTIPLSAHPPTLQFPPQFPKSTNNSYYNVEAPSPGVSLSHNFNASPTLPGIDISKAMLGLLNRCNEVIINLKDNLGHLPYHRL